MSKLLEAISRRFTSSLHRGVGIMRGEGQRPKKTDWLDKLLVFFALERCRDLLKDGDTPIWCRFSMGGLPKDKAKAKARKLIDSVRGLHSLADGETTLSEYLVDFSFSEHKLDQLLGTEPMPSKGKFKLLLTAESEMSPNEHKVLEDFIKLVDIKSPIKVMVFQARKDAEKTSLIRAFQDTLARHGRFEPTKERDWLFLGVPTYAEWIAKWDDPSGLPRQVLVLDPDSAPHTLIERDWWEWKYKGDSGCLRLAGE